MPADTGREVVEVDHDDAEAGALQTADAGKGASFKGLDGAAAAGPAGRKPQEESKYVPFLAMFRYAEGLDFFLVVGGAIGALANGCAMGAFSILLGNIFDSLNGLDPSSAESICLIFVWIGIGLGFASILQVGCFEMAAERMTIKLRREYLIAILNQEVAFFDRSEAAELASSISEATIHFREALGAKFGALIQFSSMFIVGLCVGFKYVWQLTLVILAITPLLGLSGYIMMTAMQRMLSSQLSSYAQAGAVAEETFQLIRTITGLNLQSRRLATYRVLVDDAAKQIAKQGLSAGIGFGLTMLIYFSSYGVAFWVGAVLVANSRNSLVGTYQLSTPPPESFCALGAPIPQNCSSQSTAGLFFGSTADICNCPLCMCGCYPQGLLTPSSLCLTGGEVILTFFAVLIGSFGVGQAMPSITALNSGRLAAFRIYSVIDRKPEITNDSTKTLDNVLGEITFENVDFVYPSRPEAKVLTNLNLVIKAGTRVGLCGQSGSGKSTIIALLERFYDPTAGRVLLDGVDIRDLNLNWLREQFGLVSQEPVLFATSIRENIRTGRLDATDEEVEKACRDANAHGFIEGFPQGYDTFVGSAGSQLSGGQKQRLAIARALLRNPRVLLLDEATAALDNESERMVNEAIEKLLTDGSAKRTSIVIAHRLSSIKSCDEIVVLERGVVLEKGNHTALLAKQNSMYGSLLALAEGGQRADDQSGIVLRRTPEPAALIKPAVKESNAGPADGGDKDSKKTVDDKADVSLEESTDKSKDKVKNVPLRRAWEFISTEDKILLIPAVAGAMVNGAGFPVFAFLLSRLMNVFFLPTVSQLLSQAQVWSLAFFGLAVAIGLALFFMNTYFEKVNGHISARVRAALFERLISFEIGYFDQKENSVGVLTARLASDAALVKASLTDRVAVGVQNITTVCTGIIIAFVASWKLSLVVFAIFPALALAGAAQMIVMMGMAQNDRSELAAASQTLSEAISGVRTVTAFSMQKSIGDLYTSQLAGPMKRSTRKGFMAGAGFGLSQSTMFWAYALCFWYGATLIANEGLSFQNMNQALFGVLMSAMALGQVSAMAPDLGKGQSAVNSVYQVLDRTSAINPFSEQGDKPSEVKGEIKFVDATFAYPTRKDIVVMKRLNLTIPAGATVAFVGTSGSGKSTAVMLMERFYDVDEGSVLLDGRNVRDLNVNWLRSQIGLVSQEPALLDCSIVENIRSGRQDATDEECIEAARMANAYEFIMRMPDQFNTSCGAKGSQLSGGQKQRIAIARALVKKPAILLLDEATSALDEESQRIVQDALDKLLASQRRTTFVIAHRLSTIRSADMICVLSAGSVIETGRFDELMAKGGAFAQLSAAQGAHS